MSSCCLHQDEELFERQSNGPLVDDVERETARDLGRQTLAVAELQRMRNASIVTEAVGPAEVIVQHLAIEPAFDHAAGARFLRR